MPESDSSLVVPAQLAFLTIYNPLLGLTDETITDQIVFYTSKSTQSRCNETSSIDVDVEGSRDEWNQRLRQIGLSQGMVNFARNFSNGQPVDFVETDKTRIVIHELEKNWWILASIDLTRLPSDAATGSSQDNASDTPSFRYSSRETCPPHLLIQQLRRAHSTFLLHHDFTLDGLYQRVGRSTFCLFLDRFWTKFAWAWEVLLSGNPTVDIYNGIKLSVGGELGIGVGEEEWGSGERAVLEDFVGRTDGLVDLVVSRFGDPPTTTEDTKPLKKPESTTTEGNGKPQWLGSERHPRPYDGVIFSGVGAISRTSLAQVSQWMEWIYRYGDEAYGVGEDPTSTRRHRHRKRRARPRTRDKSTLPGTGNSPQDSTQGKGFSPGIPKPLVKGTGRPPQNTDEQSSAQISGKSSPARSVQGGDWTGLGTDTFMKLLTLGYGSSWSLPSRTPSTHPRDSPLRQEDSPNNAEHTCSSDARQTPGENPSRNGDNAKSKFHSPGTFLIGLRDDIQGINEQSPEYQSSGCSKGNQNSRILHRTVHIQLASPAPNETGMTKLRIVTYVNQPFMFTFLFDPQTPSLSDSALYQSIHHQLGPLHKPLSASSSPENAAMRISMSEDMIDPNKRFSTKDQPVYEFVYDPSNLTIRSTIPNIPDLGSYSPEALASGDPRTLPWSRVESLNIHHRLLSTYNETRSRPREVERTCKTSRGWWIIWVRLSDSTTDNENSNGTNPPQEAFLIRKASDYVSPAGHSRGGSSAARFFRDLGVGSSSGLQSARSDMAPGKLVEGLGLDARRYIENLLSLNR